MKKLFLAAVLISGLSFGQYFEQNNSEPNQDYFTDDGTMGGPTFGTDPGAYDGDPPDQGEEAGFGPGGPGNPGPRMPIDGWFWLLPAAGLALGYRMLKPAKKEKSI